MGKYNSNTLLFTSSMIGFKVLLAIALMASAMGAEDNAEKKDTEVAARDFGFGHGHGFGHGFGHGLVMDMGMGMVDMATDMVDMATDMVDMGMDTMDTGIMDI